LHNVLFANTCDSDIIFDLFWAKGSQGLDTPCLHYEQICGKFMKDF